MASSRTVSPMGSVIAFDVQGAPGQRHAALRFSQWLAGEGAEVCLVEGDIQRSDLRSALESRTPGLGRMLPGQLLRIETLKESMMIDPRSQVEVLLGPAWPAEASPIWFQAAAYKGVLQLLKEHYQIVVMSMPLYDTGVRADLLGESADVAVMGGPTPAALIRTARRALQVLDSAPSSCIEQDEVLMADLRGSLTARTLMRAWDGTEPSELVGAAEGLSRQEAEILQTLVKDDLGSTARPALSGSRLSELVQHAVLAGC